MFERVFKILFPTGRAFRYFFKDNDLKKLLKGISYSFDRVKKFQDGILKDAYFSNNRQYILKEQDIGIQKKGLTAEQSKNILYAAYTNRGGNQILILEENLKKLGVVDLKIYENLEKKNPALLGDFEGTFRYTCGDPKVTCGSGALCDKLLKSNYELLVNGSYSQTLRLFLGTCGDSKVTCGFFESVKINRCGYFEEYNEVEKQYEFTTDERLFSYYLIIANEAGIDVPVEVPAELESDFKGYIINLKPAHSHVLLSAIYVNNSTQTSYNNYIKKGIKNVKFRE